MSMSVKGKKPADYHIPTRRRCKFSSLLGVLPSAFPPELRLIALRLLVCSGWEIVLFTLRDAPINYPSPLPDCVGPNSLTCGGFFARRNTACSLYRPQWARHTKCVEAWPVIEQYWKEEAHSYMEHLNHPFVLVILILYIVMCINLN